MRINSSVVGMESARSYSSVSSRYFRFSVGGGQSASDSQATEGSEREVAGHTNGNQGSTGSMPGAMEELRTKFNGFSARITYSAGTIYSRGQSSMLGSIRQQGISYFFKALFGELRPGHSRFSEDGMGFLQMGNARTYTYEEVMGYVESETTTFSTQGKVVCADGREIDFQMNLQMSRSFEAYYREQYTMTQPVFLDPLVINLDGNIAELTDQTFLFDIDGDGEEDEISRLNAGSGYLALDKNKDGTVNDGNELFGTTSGNGFADLAKYDADRNGWIDEGDPIWDQLRIWVMDERGDGQLYGLSEKGVGAICLSNVSTDFALNGDNNEARGRIRQSGLFLYENGAVGSVQQVDVAKYDQIG